MLNQTYNPDVLTCIANLSSDEVFTPPSVVNQMLDTLPKELWSDEKVTFLDPVSKSGVFLREITKRLIDGLEGKIPNLEDRIEHILRKQVFGIGITELTSLISRRSLYCSKYANGKYSIVQFDDEQGNLKYFETEHTWEGGSCKYCGVNKTVFERDSDLENYSYSFLHVQKPEKLFHMKFDVIIGNPPYQMSDGGSGYGKSALPIYNKFVEQGKKLNPKYLSMIIPSRWFAGGRGLGKFREDMLSDKRISIVVDYPKSRDCFPGVDIAGGVCYFLWDKNKTSENCEFISIQNGEKSSSERKLSDDDILIRDNIGVNIIKKIQNKKRKFFGDEVLTSNPFGFRSFERGGNLEENDTIKLIHSDGFGFVKRNQIEKNKEVIDSYKVYIGKINPDRGGVNNSSDGKSNVITKVKVAIPKEITSETYLILSSFDNEIETNNCVNFFKTKFSRYLVLLTLSSMNITKSNFRFVPILDFTLEWKDSTLYKLFDLTNEEITHIENQIKEMK